MLENFSRGVTRDSYGPVSCSIDNSDVRIPVSIDKYHDAYSLFGWGRMPDPLIQSGRINSFVFSYLNSLIQAPEAWTDFLRSPDALTFRKAASSLPQAGQSGKLSSMLNEIGETFPMRSSFIGAIDEKKFNQMDSSHPITDRDFIAEPFQFSLDQGIYPVCEHYVHDRLEVSSVMGRSTWDASHWSQSPGPKVVPFQVTAHFELDVDSLKSVETSEFAIPKTSSRATLKVGEVWDFPLLELSLWQHPFQRKLDFSEALWISKWTPEFLQEFLLKAAWCAAFTRYHLSRSQVKLKRLPLKFGLNGKGDLVLVESLSLSDFVFHSELEQFYKKTSWYDGVIHAQKQATQGGHAEWKRFCAEPAPFLERSVKENAERKFIESGQQILGSTIS